MMNDLQHDDSKLDKEAVGSSTDSQVKSTESDENLLAQAQTRLLQEQLQNYLAQAKSNFFRSCG